MKLFKLSIAILCMLSILLLNSCSNGGETVSSAADVNVDELLNAAVSAYDRSSLPELVYYRSSAGEDSDDYLDSGYAGLLFADEYGADIPALAKAESYAMAMPSGKRVFEIDIIKTSDRNDNSEIKELLEKRFSVKDNGEIIEYTPEEAPYLEAVEYHIMGNYVIMLVTHDNSIARGVIENMLNVSGTAENAAGEASTVQTENVQVKNPASGSTEITDMQSSVNVSIEELKAASKGASEDTQVGLKSEKCEKPNITVVKHIANDIVFFGGTVEPGAEIHVTGGLHDEMVFRPDDNVIGDTANFWAGVNIPLEGTSFLSVTVEKEGKEPSTPVTMTVRARNDVHIFENHGVCGVVVGNDFQGHFQGAIADYVGSNLLNDKQKEGVERAVKKKVDTVKNNGGKLLYIIIPNPMNLYPETVPVEYVHYTEETLTNQFIGIAKSCGADVIDLTETLNEHKYDYYKIYNKMDSHWTEYGAYLGYLELCKYLSQDFPDAVARDEKLFKFYEKELYAGDMCTHLEVDNKRLKEVTTLCDLLFDSPADEDFFMPGKMEVEHTVTQDEHTIVNNDKTRDLPSAIIHRDSFSSAINGMVNDIFSKTYWESMWSYGLNEGKIKNAKPDYVIYLVTERNICNIMY